VGRAAFPGCDGVSVLASLSQSLPRADGSISQIGGTRERARRRGRPLESLETAVNLIGSTTTAAGLRIRAGLDRNRYPKGIEVTDEEMAALDVTIARVRGEWSYLMKPRTLK